MENRSRDIANVKLTQTEGASKKRNFNQFNENKQIPAEISKIKLGTKKLKLTNSIVKKESSLREPFKLLSQTIKTQKILNVPETKPATKDSSALKKPLQLSKSKLHRISEISSHSPQAQKNEALFKSPGGKRSISVISKRK